MSQKQKKKRNKAYAGSDAAKTRPSITRISAVRRSKPRQWWHDNKRIAKPVIITVAVVAFIIWLIYEFIRIANGQ